VFDALIYQDQRLKVVKVRQNLICREVHDEISQKVAEKFFGREIIY